MKKLLLSLMGVAGIFPACAQLPLFSCSLDKATAVDTALYKVTYRLDYTCHSKADTRFDDVRTLLIGRRAVKDRSEILFHYDSLMTADMHRGAEAFSNPKGNPWPYEIMVSPKERVAEMKYRLPSGMDILSYSERVPEIQWNFAADATVVVLGYECQLATADFSGRHYSAWFAPELPLPYGPYKFGGLPGLILRIQDDAGQFVWEAEGFEKSSDPIYRYDYESEKACTAIEAAKTIARCFNSPIAFQLAAIGGGKGRIYIVGKDGRTRDATEEEETPVPYEPIEML